MATSRKPKKKPAATECPTPEVDRYLNGSGFKLLGFETDPPQTPAGLVAAAEESLTLDEARRARDLEARLAESAERSTAVYEETDEKLPDPDIGTIQSRWEAVSERIEWIGRQVPLLKRDPLPFAKEMGILMLLRVVTAGLEALSEYLPNMES